jgi:NhaP-type Na+/H+ or K+/H+ antiporter
VKTDASKITIAGIVTAVLGGAGFIWSQWSQGIGDFVSSQPLAAAAMVAAILAAAAFGIVRSIMHRRRMGTRVRRGRPESP